MFGKYNSTLVFLHIFLKKKKSLESGKPFKVDSRSMLLLAHLNLHCHHLSVSIFEHLLLWNHWANWSQVSFHHGMGEWKFVRIVQVTWARWPPCPTPYMVKPFKNLLRNQWADCLETWYVAFGTRAHHNLFKWWPWVDLFYTKVKFGHLCCCLRESENWRFFINCCIKLSQSWYMYMQLTAWIDEAIWVSKVKVIPWPLTKVAQILKSKLVFLRNYWTSWNQISYESSSEQGNENLLIRV